MRWPDRKKKITKKKIKELSFSNVACKNCESIFTCRFCPECGQAYRDVDKPFSFIFYNFVGDVFAFDTRFFRTFKALLLKPGFLTCEYFQGRRIRYAPPFRIFLFVSFILFLLLQIYTNRGLTTVLDSDFNEGIIGIDSVSLVLADSIIRDEINSVAGSTFVANADSIFQEKKNQKDSIVNNQNFKITMETFRNSHDLREALNKYANYLESELEKETNPKEVSKKKEYKRLCRSHEQVTPSALEYMSWAFFMLLPVFALVLKLVYIRRNQNYMRHLIFSIHIHSFLFIVFILTTLIYMWFDRVLNWFSMQFEGSIKSFTAIVVISIPVYIIIALKRFYGQTTGKVILKFFIVSILYYTVFAIMVGLAILNALSII